MECYAQMQPLLIFPAHSATSIPANQPELHQMVHHILDRAILSSYLKKYIWKDRKVAIQPGVSPRCSYKDLRLHYIHHQDIQKQILEFSFLPFLSDHRAKDSLYYTSISFCKIYYYILKIQLHFCTLRN